MTPDHDAALVTRMEERLLTVPEATFAALERFSEPMLSEILARIGQIESKAISILGWSTALLGLLLIQNSGATPAIANRWLLRAAIVATVIALGAAANAARARHWQWPSPSRHWFCEEQFDSPTKLRGIHLLALLEAYQSHANENERKARALTISQWAIAAAGALVAAALLAGL